MKKSCLMYDVLFYKDNPIPVWFYETGRGDGLSLGLLCKTDGYIEPFLTVTTGVYGITGAPEQNKAFVKDYSENEGMGEWLVRNKLARPTGKIAASGFVELMEYEFDLERVNGFMYEEEKAISEEVPDDPDVHFIK